MLILPTLKKELNCLFGSKYILNGPIKNSPWKPQGANMNLIQISLFEAPSRVSKTRILVIFTGNGLFKSNNKMIIIEGKKIKISHLDIHLISDSISLRYIHSDFKLEAQRYRDFQIQTIS